MQTPIVSRAAVWCAAQFNPIFIVSIPFWEHYVGHTIVPELGFSTLSMYDSGGVQVFVYLSGVVSKR